MSVFISFGGIAVQLLCRKIVPFVACFDVCTWCFFTFQDVELFGYIVCILSFIFSIIVSFFFLPVIFL